MQGVYFAWIWLARAADFTMDGLISMESLGRNSATCSGGERLCVTWLFPPTPFHKESCTYSTRSIHSDPPVCQILHLIILQINHKITTHDLSLFWEKWLGESLNFSFNQYRMQSCINPFFIHLSRQGKHFFLMYIHSKCYISNTFQSLFLFSVWFSKALRKVGASVQRTLLFFV